MGRSVAVQQPARIHIYQSIDVERHNVVARAM